MTQNSPSPEQHLLNSKLNSKEDLLALLAYCEEHIAKDPTLAAFWRRQSYCLARLGRYREAIGSYQKTLALVTENPKVWCNYASALAASGQLSKSINAYDRSLDLEPTYGNAWRRRGNALYRLGEYVRAIESYDQALALAPTDSRLWYAKGLATFQLNLAEQAINHFKIAIENNTDNREAYTALIYALISAGRYTETRQFLESLFAQGWNDAYLHDCYAYLLQQQGDGQAARKHLQQAIENNPQYANLWFRMGLILTQLNHYSEAHNAFRE
ncbi:MAG: tetratricopeptide repeat protein, partial [Leptolyngbya sp. SIO1D8]|nr:tetratricopeptide repeat protein [Leptolyngbya sp. SIO1D8]